MHAPLIGIVLKSSKCSELETAHARSYAVDRRASSSAPTLSREIFNMVADISSWEYVRSYDCTLSARSLPFAVRIAYKPDDYVSLGRLFVEQFVTHVHDYIPLQRREIQGSSIAAPSYNKFVCLVPD